MIVGKFYLKWRLQKHMDVHSENSPAKHCHYYNNSKVCPYEHIGCMFRYEKAGKCKNHACKFDLCQFEHVVDAVEDIANVESDDEDLHDVENTDNLGENDCHLCNEVFTNVDALCEHFKTNHEEYHQNIVLAAQKYHMEANTLTSQS